MIDLVNKALIMLEKEPDPLVKICSCSCYWITFSWLYDEMKKNKDIIRVQDLPEEKKKEYWNIVCKARPDRDREVRYWMVQAIHAYLNCT